MTRPCTSLNWYDPGASGIVPVGGRFTIAATGAPATTCRLRSTWTDGRDPKRTVITCSDYGRRGRYRGGRGRPILVLQTGSTRPERSLVPRRPGRVRHGGRVRLALRAVVGDLRLRARRQAVLDVARTDPQQGPRRRDLAHRDVAARQRPRRPAAVVRGDHRPALVLRCTARGAGRGAPSSASSSLRSSSCRASSAPSSTCPGRLSPGAARRAARLRRRVPEPAVLLRHPGVGARA